MCGLRDGDDDSRYHGLKERQLRAGPPRGQIGTFDGGDSWENTCIIFSTRVIHGRFVSRASVKDTCQIHVTELVSWTGDLKISIHVYEHRGESNRLENSRMKRYVPCGNKTRE